MKALFQFNTSATDLISGVDFAEQFNNALAEIEQLVVEELERVAPDENYDVSWGEGGIVVSLNEEQAEREFGSPGTPMRPAVRTALISAAGKHNSRAIVS